MNDTTGTGPVVLVVPAYRNAATLPTLVDRIDRAVRVDWRVRIVDDACPAGSGDAADALAAHDDRVRVLHLQHNTGQHHSLAAGLLVEPDAVAWVCLDGDLQDPPEAVPALLHTLATTGVAGVFAGRRGAYEPPIRRLTGAAHRAVLAAVTGLPHDAGAFLALGPCLRTAVVSAVLQGRAPSVVVAAGATGLPLLSIPVRRDTRTVGTSAWTSRARLTQSIRTLTWAYRHTPPRNCADTPRSQRWARPPHRTPAQLGPPRRCEPHG